MKDELLELYQELWEYSEERNLKESQPYLEVVKEILSKGPSYLRQREWARQKPADYRFIVNNLLKETQENNFLE